MKANQSIRRNQRLGFTLILMLVSGIHLEVTEGAYEWAVWVHIGLALTLTALSIHHIFCHYKTGNWFVRFAKNRNKVTCLLWWMSLFTIASGLAATVHWLLTYTHSPLGGIHGKIGLVMALTALVHAARHIRKRRMRDGSAR